MIAHILREHGQGGLTDLRLTFQGGVFIHRHITETGGCTGQGSHSFGIVHKRQAVAVVYVVEQIGLLDQTFVDIPDLVIAQSAAAAGCERKQHHRGEKEA